MSDSTRTTHADLLALARAVRRAAVDDDIDRLHLELARLRGALVDHVRDERVPLARVGGAAGAVLRNGQRRLVALLDDLLADGGDHQCTCLVRAADLEAALRRQARLEAVLLGRGRL